MSISKHEFTGNCSSDVIYKCESNLVSPEISSDSRDNFPLLSVRGVSGPDVNNDGDTRALFTELAGKDCGSKSDILVLRTPKSKNGVSINVFQSCIAGKCQCSHVLGGNKTQLMPCRFSALMFVDRQLSDSDLDVYSCVVDGVDIVSGEIQSYDCRNYCSILVPESKSKMDVIVANEIENGILTPSDVKPHCIHSLGAVGKPDGGIRPITDCSRPEGVSVNCNVDVSPWVSSTKVLIMLSTC